LILADTQQLFRRGLRSLLSSENDLEIVTEVVSFEDLISGCSHQADLWVIDVSLLQPASESQILELRHRFSATPALVLSKEDRPELFDLAMTAGARAYMLKSSPAAQLIAGIRRVATGHESANMESTADLQALAESGRKTGRPDVLTNREQEILRLLAERRTVRETAAELSLSSKTVEAHKLNLMRKLNIHNRSALIEYAIDKGFISVSIPA
jgi:DNA-binding NarL/FixJ family response regulator